MENPIDIKEIIRRYKEYFQINFILIKRTGKYKLGLGSRVININKYQSKEIVITRFYKKISRILYY